MSMEQLDRHPDAVHLPRRAPPAYLHQGAARPITIGLVNNMPDAALSATEAQFRRLIERAAGERQVRLKLFSIPDVARSETARDHMAERYASTETLPSAGVDALIVTGAEPMAAALQDEPYWPSLTALVDWAEANSVSTVWSCLAAHAAVLHLDGISRHPLPAKLSGVFSIAKVGRHPLLTGAAGPLFTPHSRQNGLDEGELIAKGYKIVTRSAAAGVDAFTREGASLFVFFQGHPEYDADSLMMEYRRDVRRFIRGERGHHPEVPSGYFEPVVERRLQDLAARTLQDPRPAMLLECAKIIAAHPPEGRWRAGTQRIYRNWLDLVAAGVKARPTPSCRSYEGCSPGAGLREWGCEAPTSQPAGPG